MSQTTRPTNRRTDDAMMIASHLVGHEGIGAIHIVTGKRPNYDDIVRYRKMADAEGLRLTVESNALVMRRNSAEEGIIQPDQSIQSSTPVFESTYQSSIEMQRNYVAEVVARTWHWASEHVSAWQAGFAGIHEGVR